MKRRVERTGCIDQRRKSVYNLGTDIEKIGESASAEGAKLRLQKARSL